MDALLDVAICGAGPAGCATALALRGQGVARVALVDWPLERPWAIGESATPDVGPMLTRLGVPQALKAHSPYQGTLSLWGGQHAEVNDFLHRGQGPGWHLDRTTFDAQLQQAAVDQGVALLHPARVERLAWQCHDGDASGWWQLALSDQQQLKARLLVDASGRRAELATRLGAQRQRLDTLVALGVRLRIPHETLSGLSLIEPFSHGWWYAAPLPDGHTVICLMTDAEIAQTQGWRDAARFLRAWRDTQVLSQYLPPPTAMNSNEAALRIASFAAHSSCLTKAAGPGWIAVGDALMSFDPLTSSGISGALNDALCSAATVSGWLQGDPMAPGGQAWARRADTTWRRYLDQRHTHYAAESRWSQSPFWATRHQPPLAPPSRSLPFKEPHHGTLQGLRLQGTP